MELPGLNRRHPVRFPAVTKLRLLPTKAAQCHPKPPTSHPRATCKPSTSQLVGTDKPPPCDLHSTIKLPQSPSIQHDGQGMGCDQRSGTAYSQGDSGSRFIAGLFARWPADPHRERRWDGQGVGRGPQGAGRQVAGGRSGGGATLARLATRVDRRRVAPKECSRLLAVCCIRSETEPRERHVLPSRDCDIVRDYPDDCDDRHRARPVVG